MKRKIRHSIKTFFILISVILLIAVGCSKQEKQAADDMPSGAESAADVTHPGAENPTNNTQPGTADNTQPGAENPTDNTQPGTENPSKGNTANNISSETENHDTKEITDAIYLGVQNYGAEDVNKNTKNNFSYRFQIGGKETILKIDNGSMNSKGKYTYPIQNRLKEGYSYEIQIENGIVTAAEEKKSTAAVNYQPPVKGTPGLRTLKNFLSTAFMPVGTTLYIYGGGWDWQDEGSGIQANTMGISDDWIRFFRSQNVNYTYRDRNGDKSLKDPANSYYPYGGYNEYYYAGLDCSGYVGWTIYNIMNTKSGLNGYVMSSTRMARTFSENGWGEWTQKTEKPANHENSAFLPGDIFSISGHVWICLGTCEDGSILILHSTPSMSRTGQPGGGPQLSAIGKDESCEAYRLADHYMSEYFPDWYARYPVIRKDYPSYTACSGEYAGKFSWSLSGKNGGISDPDNYRYMTPKEILEDIFATIQSQGN